jgi:hypothetical protein
MRVDVLLGDWRSELEPEATSEEKERLLYDRAWGAYQEGDYGFGVWCWYECDRLTNAFGGSVREVTRVLGEGRYLGFSHRRAIAEKVPMEKVYRPRKGDMSTPRQDATVLGVYQLLSVYAVRAKLGDPKAKAELAIALLEHDDRRRADAFFRHFETFQRLLDRATAPVAPGPVTAPAPAPLPEAVPVAAAPAEPARRGRRPKAS